MAHPYQSIFDDSECTFFTEPENCQSNYWLNAIITDNRKQGDELLEYTNKNGVMPRPIWKLRNRLPLFKDCPTDEPENSNWLANRVANIPSAAVIPGNGK